MIEAAKRARMDKVPIVQKDHGEIWRFVMWLAVNDMVEIERENIKIIYRVQKLDGANKRITLRHQLASTLDDKDQELVT